MASYRGHLALAAPLGAVYGGLWLLRPEFDWGPAILAAGATSVGGLLPDLDSDSGVPVRELFSFVAAAVAALACAPLLELDVSFEQTLVLLAGIYLALRYGMAALFKRWTVHRGMFHSIPAMLIAGLLVWEFYPGPDAFVRLFLTGGVMLGFLSHLILDEIYAYDFNGLLLRPNKFAGSALKFASPSWGASLACYGLLGLLGWYGWTGGVHGLQWPAAVPRPSWLPGSAFQASAPGTESGSPWTDPERSQSRRDR